MSGKQKYKFLTEISRLSQSNQEKLPFESVGDSAYDFMRLFFHKTKKEVVLGTSNKGDLMPRSSGVYWTGKYAIAFTCGEHYRGATSHNFEVHILDHSGKVLKSIPKQTNEKPLLDSQGIIKLVGYPLSSYPGTEYKSAPMSIVSINSDTLEVEEQLIDAPEKNQKYFIRENVSSIFNGWLKEDGKVYATCRAMTWTKKANLLPKLRYKFLVN